MMQVFDHNKYYLVAPKIFSFVAGTFRGGKISEYKGLVSIEINDYRIIEENIGKIGLSNLHLRRYLDKFFILLPTGENSLLASFYDDFFCFLGEDYFNFIDFERNIENISFQIAYIKKTLQDSKNLIIDFGCGPGTSIPEVSLAKFEVMGVDVCPTMVFLANKRGMRAVTFDEFRQMSDDVAAAFSSYVFHLITDFSSIEILLERLVPGGLIIANFHKQRNVENVVEFMVMRGITVNRLESPIGYERHGSYFIFKK